VPCVEHCSGRLMSLMPDAATPPVGYLTKLLLPYLRTAVDLEYVQAAHAVAVGTLRWWAGLGRGVRGLQIGRDAGWTAFVGPSLASPRGWIGAVMSPSDWATCAWISWPLMVAVVGLDSSLIVFRSFWRDLIFASRAACIGRLRSEAESRALEGRLLPHISAGWDQKAATQRRRLVCPLGAGVLACVGPLWPR